MASVVLESSHLRLVIRPDLGAGISDFSLKGPSNYFYPLMRRASEGEMNPSNLACFVMAPWANRIAGAAFSFDGKAHKLRATSSDGSAIHGDVRSRRFETLDRSPLSARFRFDSGSVSDVNFPWPFAITLRYELNGLCLMIDLDIHNTGDEPFPAGCGLHPYFNRRLFSSDDVVLLHANLTGQFPLASGCAIGPHRPSALGSAVAAGCPLPATHTDAALWSEDGQASIHWPASAVSLKMDGGTNQPFNVLFVPHGPSASGTSQPLPYFAFEPQTNINDAFNLVAAGNLTARQAGMCVLQAGESMHTQTIFTVEFPSLQKH